MFYFQPKTEVQEIYYDFHRRFGRGAQMFPFIDKPHQQYLSKYLLLNEIHKRLHPFSFLEEGQNVVMVGIHDGYIELGYSTLFITSAIVGDKGHVWAVDPDQRNIMAINKFVEVNRIKNVTAIQLGVWKEKGNMEIVLFRDYSSSNKLAPIFDSSQFRASHIWGKERIETQVYRKTIEVDTLDSIINKRIQKKIDHLNLTINGAEPEAIEGCSQTINSINTIAFPLRDIRSSMYEDFKKKNFNIAIADAPTKAWEDKPFLYACATRQKEAELFKRDFKKATIEIIDDDLSPFPFKINYSHDA